MLELWNQIVCLVNYAIQTMRSYIVDALELPFDFFVALVNGVLSLLPQDPRSDAPIQSQILDMFNYVIPMQTIVAEAIALIVAWILYRIYQWALAWGKADF